MHGCKVAVLVNTATFGRQEGDDGVVYQDQFCPEGTVHIVAIHCSQSAVGSSSLGGNELVMEAQPFQSLESEQGKAGLGSPGNLFRYCLLVPAQVC